MEANVIKAQAQPIGLGVILAQNCMAAAGIRRTALNPRFIRGGDGGLNVAVVCDADVTAAIDDEGVIEGCGSRGWLWSNRLYSRCIRRPCRGQRLWHCRR